MITHRLARATRPLSIQAILPYCTNSPVRSCTEQATENRATATANFTASQYRAGVELSSAPVLTVALLSWQRVACQAGLTFIYWNRSDTYAVVCPADLPSAYRYACLHPVLHTAGYLTDPILAPPLTAF